MHHSDAIVCHPLTFVLQLLYTAAKESGTSQLSLKSGSITVTLLATLIESVVFHTLTIVLAVALHSSQGKRHKSDAAEEQVYYSDLASYTHREYRSCRSYQGVHL